MLVFPANPNEGDVFAPGGGLPSWMWDGEKWTHAASPPLKLDLDLDELGDVTLTTPAELDVLQYSGGRWRNRPERPVPIAFTIPKLTDTTTLTVAPTFTLYIPPNFPESMAACVTPPSTAIGWALQKVYTAGGPWLVETLGTITWSSGSGWGNIAGGGGTVGPGQLLRLDTQGWDAAIASVAVTIQTWRR